MRLLYLYEKRIILPILAEARFHLERFHWIFVHLLRKVPSAFAGMDSGLMSIPYSNCYNLNKRKAKLQLKFRRISVWRILELKNWRIYW